MQSWRQQRRAAKVLACVFACCKPCLWVGLSGFILSLMFTDVAGLCS
jgi:hypothetical protein